MLNKNTCEYIWFNVLKNKDEYIFKQEYTASNYRKGRYNDYVLKGIFYNKDRWSLMFKNDDVDNISWDNINFDSIRYITEEEFPELKNENVNKLQNTLVRLRTVESNIDFCYNNLMGEIYEKSLDNIKFAIQNDIDEVLKEIMKYINLD
jgi:hypothetical protein